MGLASLTVKELKSKLKDLGLAVTGRKNELIERIEEAEAAAQTGNGAGADAANAGDAAVSIAGAASRAAANSEAGPAAETGGEKNGAQAEARDGERPEGPRTSDDEGSLSMGSEDDEEAQQGKANASPKRATAKEAPQQLAREPAVPAQAPAPADEEPVLAAPAAKVKPDAKLASSSQAELGGSKRKRAEIVFDPIVDEKPDGSTPAKVSKSSRKEIEVKAPDSETRALRIDGFRRPLREAELKEKLSETGKVEAFWMDALKSYCYVIYATTADAAATLRATAQQQWPPRAVQSVMQPKFVTLFEAEAVLESDGQVRVHAAAAAPADVTAAADAADVDMDASADVTASVEATGDGTAADAVAAFDAEEATVDSIFRITKAAPPLYWMPVADDEVAARKATEDAKKEADMKEKAKRAAARQARAEAKAAAAAEAEAAEKAKAEVEEAAAAAEKAAAADRDGEDDEMDGAENEADGEAKAAIADTDPAVKDVGMAEAADEAPAQEADAGPDLDGAGGRKSGALEAAGSGSDKEA